MSIAEQLADQILDMVEDNQIAPHTTLEAMKMVVNYTATLAVDELVEENDLAVSARIKEAVRAITNLQLEIVGVLIAHTTRETVS
ncbi:MAG TPA: hypothetical protein VM910_10865 [Bradyrhizobium sp.]|jgi:hypothetical protein|nr:hypothetical protein [Bradyrhizobium sp.]